MSERYQSYYVAGELVGLVESYLDAEQVAAKSIRRRLLPYLSGGRMPILAWWQLLEDLDSQLQQPALGVHIGQQIQPYHFGVLGYLLVHTNAVAEALNGFRRYQNLLHNFGGVDVRALGANVEVVWDYGDKRSTRLSDEIVISGAVQFIRNVTGQATVSPVSVHLNYPKPEHAERYDQLLGCPVFFGSDRMSIEIPLDVLSLPLNDRDPHLRTLLARQVEAIGEHDQTTDRYLQIVQETIMEALSQGSANELLVAEQLSVSRRTLHRRLAERGTNYKQLLNQTRLQLADMYMADSKLSLAQVAFLLGYSEQSAFTRAYVKWTGRTPSQSRRLQQ